MRTNTNQRAPLTHLLVLVLIPLVLSACGFQVRTTEVDSLGFTEASLECDRNANWDLCLSLERELRAHAVELTDAAPFVLTVSQLTTNERVFTVNSTDASADEFELSRSMKFSLEERDNQSSRYTNEVSARRIYRHNSSALLSKDREKDTITKSLDTSLAKEVIRQLTLIRIGN